MISNKRIVDFLAVPGRTVQELRQEFSNTYALVLSAGEEGDIPWAELQEAESLLESD